MDGLTSHKIIQNPCMNLLRRIKPHRIVGLNHVMKPKIGTMWKQHNLVVEIVNKNHPEYIAWARINGYRKLGDVMYIYRSGTSELGRIGCFQQTYSFLRVWTPC